MMRFAVLYLAMASNCAAQQQQQQQQQRRVSMMGGYSPTDVKNPFVVSAAKFALTSSIPESKYSFALGGENSQIRVIKAEQQVCTCTCVHSHEFHAYVLVLWNMEL
jgi:hypothetical protein